MTLLKLLYVDDEPDIREIATFALELDPQIQVRTQPSGAAALEMLRSDGWRPDLVLLDVMMPEMDGPTTLLRLRELEGLGRTPVVFITARAQAHEKEALVEKGAIGVVTKPFDPMTLAKDVRGLLVSA